MAGPDLVSSKRKGRRWWPWLLAALPLLAFAWWWFGPSAAKSVRLSVADHYSSAAAVHLEKEEWPAALEDITTARRWSPDSPQVLRVLADFLIKANGDSFSLNHLLLRLVETGHATVSDRLRIAEFQLTQGDVTRARSTLAAIPEETRRQRRAQELLAAILRVEGHPEEAETIMRRALMADPNDSTSRFRLAMMDYQTPFPEIRVRTRERLWDLAAGGDDAALEAIEFLSGENSLSLSQAQQLLTLVKRHPKAGEPTRLKVVSALMRLQPSARDDLISQEIDDHSPETIENSTSLLQWLLDEKEYDRLLKLLPAETGSSQALMEFRLKALSGSGRWKNLNDLLSPQNLPLPEGIANLWRARAAHHLYQDPERTRHHLLAAFDAAGKGEKGEITLVTAGFAEECGLWQVAATCYRGIARAHPTAQIRMLEKVHDMALRDRDTALALESSRQLAEQNPANLSFATRLAYFRLVAGEHMEVAISGITAIPLSNLPQADRSLIRALAAYRLGDLESLRTHLGPISSDSLSPGERAVLAGLMAAAGDTGPAYRLAEKIPAALLLPEERLFLNRAL